MAAQYAQHQQQQQIIMAAIMTAVRSWQSAKLWLALA